MLTAACVSTLGASPALTRLPWGTCSLQGLDGGERSDGVNLRVWHPVPGRAWGSPGLRMGTGINSRIIASCWTATITRVSQNSADTLNQPFLILVTLCPASHNEFKSSCKLMWANAISSG